MNKYIKQYKKEFGENFTIGIHANRHEEIEQHAMKKDKDGNCGNVSNEDIIKFTETFINNSLEDQRKDIVKHLKKKIKIHKQLANEIIDSDDYHIGAIDELNRIINFIKGYGLH